MTEKLLLKLQRYCLMLVLICLPFLTTQIIFIGQPLSHIMNRCFLDKISLFFLPLGVGLAVLTQMLYGDFFKRTKTFLSFALISLILLGICEGVAVSMYDFTGMIYYQHGFAFLTAEVLRGVGLVMTPEDVLKFSYWSDMFYNAGTYLVWSYGGAYWIYCLYAKQKEALFNIMLKIGMVCFVGLALYGLVEVFYFEGYAWAEDFLVFCNPYLHRIGDSYGNWPPLLMSGKVHRMRSVFAEPSYMGIYFAFLMPFLWYGLLTKGKENSKLWLLVNFVVFYMTFMSRSRTGYGISLIQLGFCAIILLYLHKKEYYAGFRRLCLTCVLGALLAQNITGIDVKGINNLEGDNCRWGYMAATLNIGFDYPIFGTGSELFNYYVEGHEADFSRRKGSMARWTEYLHKHGQGYPQLCEYTTLFAKHGVIGVGIFMFPLLLLVYKLWKKIKLEEDFPVILTIGTALLGLIAAGISNNIDITYCYWVILGTGYAWTVPQETDKCESI
jgi:hypothetical protein